MRELDQQVEVVMGAPTDRVPKYPGVKVALIDEDGNSFAILTRVARALRKAGIDQEECNAFFAEATSGDRDHLLQVVLAWVDVD